MEADVTVTGVRPYKPEVFASYGNGWRQLFKFFLPLFLIGLIFVVIQGVLSFPSILARFPGESTEIVMGVLAGFWALVSFGISIFFNNPLGYGQTFAYLKASRGDNVEIGDLFTGFRNYWSAVGAGVLVMIIVLAGTIFFIVPGIYFACKLAFVPYLIVDKKMRVNDAFHESWRMASHGRAWKVFLVGLLAIPVVIAGFICLIVGVIISFMWISAAMASLYHAIDMERKAAPAVEVQAPPAA